MTGVPPSSIRHRGALVLVVAALAGPVACGTSGVSGSPARTAVGGSTATTTSPAVALPAAEDVASLGALTLTARPSPDFALADGDVVWITGVEPGIVGYDAETGDRRVEVETGDVQLAPAAGHGALWSAEASDGTTPDTLLRIDPASGEVTHRVPAPEPGFEPESSLAVTTAAVWGLVGRFEDPEGRVLASFDPATGALLGTVPAPPGANSVRGGHGSLWVSTGDGTVERLDPADGAVMTRIPFGEGAGFLTVTDDAVWVLDALDGTVSRIDPATDEVTATMTVSAAPVYGGDIVGDDDAVWVRTTAELAVQIDAETDEVVRVLGPASGSGSVAMTDGAVWITTHDTATVYRVPTR